MTNSKGKRSQRLSALLAAVSPSDHAFRGIWSQPPVMAGQGVIHTLAGDDLRVSINVLTQHVRMPDAALMDQFALRST